MNKLVFFAKMAAMNIAQITSIEVIEMAGNPSVRVHLSCGGHADIPTREPKKTLADVVEFIEAATEAGAEVNYTKWLFEKYGQVGAPSLSERAGCGCS